MQELGRLERVKIRDIWSTEAQDFTPWLARDENLSVLADTLRMDLEIESQEKNVGPFRADILCRNADGGSWVLIENQLERTDHIHLGQLLTYAAGLHAVTICWIAASFTEEHRATLDWLNEITDDRFQFFGLEVELWKIGGSLAAPKFNVVSKPNDWIRSVTKLTRGTSENVTPRKRQQQMFWTELMKRLDEQGSPIRIKTPQPESWMDFSIGRSGFWLEARLNSTKKWIGVDLFMAGLDATAHFNLLHLRRKEVESEFGEPLEWRPLPDRKSSSVRLYRKDTDPTRENEWPKQHAWMVSTLKRFHKTFRPRVKDLDASDWPPDDDGRDE